MEEMGLTKNGKVASELTVRLEERLLHFVHWMKRQQKVVLFSSETVQFMNDEQIEKLIVDYVEG